MLKNLLTGRQLSFLDEEEEQQIGADLPRPATDVSLLRPLGMGSSPTELPEGVTGPRVSFDAPAGPPPSFSYSPPVNPVSGPVDDVYGSNAPVMPLPPSRLRDAAFLAGRALATPTTPTASPIARAIGAALAGAVGWWKGDNISGKAYAEEENARLRQVAQEELRNRLAAEQVKAAQIRNQYEPRLNEAQLDYMNQRSQSLEDKQQNEEQRLALQQARLKQQTLRDALSTLARFGKQPINPSVFAALNTRLAEAGLPTIPYYDNPNKIHQFGTDENGRALLVIADKNNPDDREVIDLGYVPAQFGIATRRVRAAEEANALRRRSIENQERRTWTKAKDAKQPGGQKQDKKGRLREIFEGIIAPKR